MKKRNRHASLKRMMRTHRVTILAVAVFGLVTIASAIAWVIANDGWRYAEPNTLRAQKNMAYCNSTSPDQTLDLYSPSGDASNVPVVIYIHGGGWRAGHRGNALIQYYLPIFLKKGIAVADISYRLASAHPYPDQNNDIACALHFLTNNQRTYDIDMTKSILFGDSAGGQLAAATALSTLSAKYPYPMPRGVIDFYGVSDFTKIVSSARPDKNARFYLGKLYAQDANGASPLTMVSAAAPPFLIIHGEKDTVVPVSQSKLLYQKLIDNGVSAELYTVPSAKHGFVGPELTRAAHQQILDRLNGFLNRTIGV